jgi:hypothetical protein
MMLGERAAVPSNITFSATYAPNTSMDVQMEAAAPNSISQSELNAIAGGWTIFYTTRSSDGIPQVFDERIAQTPAPAALSSALSSSLAMRNLTLTSGKIGSFNYSYSSVTSAGNRLILLVGHNGVYVVYLSAFAPSNSSIASAAEIAQNVSATLS